MGKRSRIVGRKMRRSESLKKLSKNFAQRGKDFDVGLIKSGGC